ncbi:MAG: enoyl-CoA hydratase [Pseudomonadota bacterium]
MADDFVEREQTGSVVTLSLNRPDKLNPLSMPVIASLSAHFERIELESDVKVVVLKARGKAFSAGHDLRELTAARQAEDGGAAALGALFDACSAMMMKIPALPQPVIAEVQGVAAAAGCQLVASCDMAVASDTARFGVNGVDMGLFCSTPMVALTRAIPRKKAFELLTTGDFLSASEALEQGLVNRVVPAEALAQTTRDLAERVAGKLSAAVRIGKQAFYEQIGMDLAQAYAFTGKVIATNMMREDTTEGVTAFLEKRAPDWSP